MQWKKNRRPSRELNQESDYVEDDFRELFDGGKDSSYLQNKLYFYEDVTPSSILRLNRQIDLLTNKLQTAKINLSLTESPIIELHISSDGGDLCSSLSTADKISKNIIPVHTYCEGMVASAGTIISVCGHKRFITENSCMLIHQLSSEHWGNYEQLKEEMVNCEILMNIIKRIYLKKTKIDESELVDMLKRDLYFSSDVCLNKGMVDTIL
jgi:ATP-dependent protease ClpP protease subunit